MLDKIIGLMKKYREIIAYLIVGVLTTVVSLVVYYGCVLTFLDPNVAWQLQAANVLSWIFSVAFAYVASRKYVFQSRETNIKKECAKFVSARLATLLMDMALMFLLVTLMKMNDKIAKLIVQVVVVIANYVLSKLLVFAKKGAK